LLDILTALGVIQRDQWDPAVHQAPDALSVINLTGITESNVVAALEARVAEAWATVDHVNPRTAPSHGIEMCTHINWVYPVPGRGDPTKPPHMLLCASFGMLRSLARFRLGWHGLRVATGRQERLPRQARVCQVCQLDGSQRQNVEDLMHFMLDCPVYQYIRESCCELFEPRRDAPTRQEHMVFLFNTPTPEHQLKLVKCLCRMTRLREHSLEVGRIEGADAPPPGFIPHDWPLMRRLLADGSL
jgi:hypothetical protein